MITQLVGTKCYGHALDAIEVWAMREIFGYQWMFALYTASIATYCLLRGCSDPHQVLRSDAKKPFDQSANLNPWLRQRLAPLTVRIYRGVSSTYTHSYNPIMPLIFMQYRCSNLAYDTN